MQVGATDFWPRDAVVLFLENIVQGGGQQPAFPKAHQDNVGREAVQPGGEGGLAAEGVNFAEKLHKGFLRQILGVDRITEHAQTESVNASRILLIDDFEGARVALLG